MTRFTLSDKLVQASIRTLSKLEKEVADLKIVLVGGMGVQVYCKNPEWYRPTNDLDVLASEQISSREFKDDLGKKIVGHLNDEGYHSSLEKERFTYAVKSQEGGEDFYIHIPRSTLLYVKRHSEWKKGEIKNAKKVEIPEVSGYPILINRIEDFLATKALRITRLSRQSYLSPQQQEELEKFREEDFKALGAVNLAKKLEDSETLRKQIYDKAMGSSKDLPKYRRYQASKDLYDLALLSRVIIDGKEPLDIVYLRKSLSYLPKENSVNFLSILQ